MFDVPNVNFPSCLVMAFSAAFLAYSLLAIWTWPTAAANIFVVAVVVFVVVAVVSTTVYGRCLTNYVSGLVLAIRKHLTV